MESVEKGMSYCLKVEYNSLMHAILTKNIDLLKALLEGVESVDCCINPPLGEFHGVLYAAVESQSREMMVYLLSLGMVVRRDDIDILWCALKDCPFDIQEILWKEFWPVLNDDGKKNLLFKAFKVKYEGVTEFFLSLSCFSEG